MAVLSGLYRIKNAESSMFLTMTSPLAPIVCSATKTGDKTSLWHVVPQSGTGVGYRLKNLAFGLEAFLDTKAAKMQLLGAQEGHAWPIEDVSGMTKIIHIGYNKLVMEQDKVAQVQTAVEKGQQAQKWIFEEAHYKHPGMGTKPAQGHPNPEPLPCYGVTPGTYILKNVKTGTVLHAQKGIGGEKDSIFSYQANGTANQKWEVRPTSNGVNMLLRNVATNMHATYLVFEQGATLELTPGALGFTITAADKGLYIAPVRKLDHVVDLTGGEAADKTPICLWIKHTEDHQKWYFEHA